MTDARKSPRDIIVRASSTSIKRGNYSAACGPSGEVEAVGVHHLGPRRHEVFHKLLLRVRARIDFREGAQLRVRTEDQVDTRAGPLDRIRLPVAPLVHAIGASGLPLRAHVEQAGEEVA